MFFEFCSFFKNFSVMPRRRKIKICDPDTTDIIRISNDKNVTRSEKSVPCEQPSFDNFQTSGEWELTGMACWNHEVFYRRVEKVKIKSFRNVSKKSTKTR